MWDSGVDDVNQEYSRAASSLVHGWYIQSGSTDVFQVFTIHALVDKSTAPLIKLRRIIPVFQKILQLKPMENPLKYHGGLRESQPERCQARFPTVQLVGYLFCLGQCLWKKVQELHLAERCHDDENFSFAHKNNIGTEFCFQVQKSLLHLKHWWIIVREKLVQSLTAGKTTTLDEEDNMAEQHRSLRHPAVERSRSSYRWSSTN